MSIRRYLAWFTPAPEGGFTVGLPDLNVVTEGDTLEDAARAVAEAADLTIDSMIEDEKRDPPEPTAFADFETPAGAGVMVVETHIPDRALRVNLSLPKSLLARIDRAAEAAGQSRSGYVAEAVRERLAAE